MQIIEKTARKKYAFIGFLANLCEECWRSIVIEVGNINVLYLRFEYDIWNTWYICSKIYLLETWLFCKRGYFRWGKISRKCWQDISHGGNFHDTTPISFLKAYGFYYFYFRVGIIFAKNAKIPPMRKFPRLQYVKNTNISYCLIFARYAENRWAG